MDRLSEMEAFVSVVDQGGFTGAAKRLGLSKSAVSKHVTALENRLGARLLDRTTRRVNPTEIGLSYYDRARRVLAEASDADDMVSSMQSAPRGLLRISAPVSFGQMFLADAVAAFLDTHPEISIDLVLDDRFVDIIEDGFDLALRIGVLADSSLKARKLAEASAVLVAAPSYLEKHGTPTTIDGLVGHDLLHYSMLSTGNHWRLTSLAGEERHVRSGGRLSANNGDVLLNAAIKGHGIVMTPSFFLSDHLKTGRLVQLLADYPLASFGIHLVYPSGLYAQPKTQAFVDFMARYFKGRGPMDW